MHMLLSIVFIFAFLTVSAFAVNIDDVMAEIAVLTTSVTAHETAIYAFPETGGTLLQALPILTTVWKLIRVVQMGTIVAKDVRLPISDDDARLFLDCFKLIVPKIKRTLTGLVARKAALTASLRLVSVLPITLQDIPVIGAVPVMLIRQELARTRTSVVAFSDAMLEACPGGEIFTQAVDLRDTADRLFGNALAAFSE